MQTEAEKRAKAKWRAKNRAKLAEADRDRRESLKLEVFTHYGLSCLRCGFSDIRALSIDHIDNNGAVERAESDYKGGFAGQLFYRELKKRGFPEGYQTLCMNCNFIKHSEYNATKRTKGNPG